MNTHKIHLLFMLIGLITVISIVCICSTHSFAAVNQASSALSGAEQEKTPDLTTANATPSNLLEEEGLKAYAAAVLQRELDALSECTDQELGYELSQRSYLTISALYDTADELLSEGLAEEAEYDETLELIAEVFDLFREHFERFGFDPFSTDLTATSYAIGSTFFPRFSMSASYNGTNIIVNFDYRIYSPFDIWWVYMGWSGELYRAKVKSSSGGAAVNSASNFGTITYTGTTSFSSRTVDLTGYITITDKAGFINWYNSNSHAFWFNTYQDSGGSETSFECSSQNPMSISNMSTVLSQVNCSHSYICESVNSTQHKIYCTKCGTVQGYDNHNKLRTDTTSKPGYTLIRCSGCAYIHSSTANVSAVCTGTVRNAFAVSNS